MRLIELGLNNPYTPVIHNVLKKITVLLVVEFMKYFIQFDPLFDTVFLRVTLFSIVGYIIYFFGVDKLIGAGKLCCPL